MTAFTLAPDGRQILAVRQKSTSNLWTFPAAPPHITDLATGQRMTTGEFLDARGRWMPDGRGVVFQSNRRGSLDIWALAGPGAPPARITSSPASERRPRVSPDGRWIAMDVSDRTGEHLWLMRPDGSDLHMPDDSWPTRFSINCCADWSPDGTRLVMHVDGKATALVRLDPATGMALETRVMDLPGADDEYHRWSPDGRRLVYEAVTDGSWDLWIVESDGSNPHRLTNLPGNERQAAWRAGSEFLYFGVERGAIWRLPLDASGRATGPPARWLEPPRRFEVDSDSIDFTRSGDRVLVTLLERASDIWLVELGVR